MNTIGTVSTSNNSARGFAWGFSVLTSLAGYQSSWLRSDLSAGLAIAAVGLPSAIAYPEIAGLPPQTGIYASISPLIPSAIFGPSRQLIVGPDAATMTILAAVLAAIVQSMPAADGERVVIAAALAVGVCFACWLACSGLASWRTSCPVPSSPASLPVSRFPS